MCHVHICLLHLNWFVHFGYLRILAGFDASCTAIMAVQLGNNFNGRKYIGNVIKRFTYDINFL